ncbi:acyltransferase family protein [Pseudotamlana carrageenivorans]|uniref:Acyltransferase n=1 Tax=Pseudotamlana carrageenivorans TaxID=2069432 RepID=A0A2I7SE17_9FLAO|nr:acyltransferase [Tamlana carrageenivorans]AUS04133.1 acyltransferase [Tamlana carrageenivorans]
MTKYNNFDFLRFLFAVFVVITHAFAISGYGENKEWGMQLSNNQVALSQIGLSGFFLISGYFMIQSLQRSKSILDYFKKRFLRLFPALMVLLIITVLLLPIVYEGKIPFYENKQVFTYIPNNLSLYCFQPVIKGVFDNNPYHSINGSLWTLRYEFSMYIAIGLLYFIKNNLKLVRVVIGAVFIVMLICYNFFLQRFGGASVLGMQGSHILNLGLFFVCGSFLATLRLEHIKNKKAVLLIGAMVLLISVYFNFYMHIKHIMLPIVVLLIGFIPLPFFSSFGKFGDASYGVYIYSFPVQQGLMYFFELKLYPLMFLSVFISIILGYLSWWLVEKQALWLKTELILNKKYLNINEF